MKHIISQTAGADENELNESKNSCKIIGKKKIKVFGFHQEIWNDCKNYEAQRNVVL